MLAVLDRRRSARSATGRHNTRGGVSLALRYLLVSVIALAVDYGVLVSLTELARVHYLYSATISFALGLVTNYALSVRWVFKDRRWNNRAGEFAVFALIGVGGLGLTVALMWLLTDGLGLRYYLSKLVTVGVVVVWNFGLRLAVVFTPSHTSVARRADHGSIVQHHGLPAMGIRSATYGGRVK
jgi:putative flippase GtrA